MPSGCHALLVHSYYLMRLCHTVQDQTLRYVRVSSCSFATSLQMSYHLKHGATVMLRCCALLKRLAFSLMPNRHVTCTVRNLRQRTRGRSAVEKVSRCIVQRSRCVVVQLMLPHLPDEK